MALHISTAIFKAAFATEAIFKLQVVMGTLLNAGPFLLNAGPQILPVFNNGINEFKFLYL